MTAAVDIAAVAKRLSTNQRTVLAGVAASSVHRAYGSASYFMGGRVIAVTATARSLIRADLVQQPELGNTCVLTDLGRAVLEHLTACRREAEAYARRRDRGSVGRDVAGFLGLIVFVAFMLACFGNWSSW